jgi:hypothetical protein
MIRRSSGHFQDKSRLFHGFTSRVGSTTGGAELAGEMKALKPTVPVVLHTAFAPEMTGHVDVFVHKGVSVVQLRR